MFIYFFKRSNKKLPLILILIKIYKEIIPEN